MRRWLAFAALVLLTLIASRPLAHAQFGPTGPVPVGTAIVQKRPVVDTNEFVGRMQAVEKVDLVARVTAFLEEVRFVEGAEVQKGDLLYVLEQPPFKADVQAKQAAVAQNQALLRNDVITLQRAQTLLNTPAGQRSNVDDAIAAQASQAAQVEAAKAQLELSEINLGYTEIRAPIAGKITRTNVTVGNVLSTSSPVTLATIYSQDPMYVLFPISLRSELELRRRYADQGGLSAVKVKLRLADGSIYASEGAVDYIEPTVAQNTDTITLRARMPNPLLPGAKPSEPGNRELVDGEFVTVVLEAPAPLLQLTIPRVAVVSDQQGSFVYVVGPDKKAEVRRITLGQSTPETAVVLSGLKDGEQVIVDGLQKIKAGAVVSPAPVAAGPKAAG